MPDYRAPGVYVEEVPSAIKPIAGVSTSTAGSLTPSRMQRSSSRVTGSPPRRSGPGTATKKNST